MAYYGTSVNGITGSNGAPAPAWANGGASNTIWDLESGGLIAPWISFWVQPGNGGSPGAFGIVKLWVRFDDLMNTTWLNIYAGKSSVDAPFSNQRNVYIGTTTPWTMYDYQPGTAEVVNNGGATNAGFAFGGAPLFYDGDRFEMANDVTSIRYFGYHINSSGGCGTQKAFSIDPCETRVSVSFIPNSSIYGAQGGMSGSGTGASGSYMSPLASTSSYAPATSNGFNYFMHLTQSFGGWGRTNGERLGVFALVGEGVAAPTGTGGGSSPSTVYTRFGVDAMANPIPNGGLNIFASWEIVTDPTGMMSYNTAPGMGGPNAPGGSTGLAAGDAAATSGLQYMTWLVQADWQPTFHGFFSASGTNSNMISLIYNQLNMMQQPTFAGVSNLPGNFNNVMAFTLSDRYWLWGSDRADISLFAQYQYMIDYGVSGMLSNFSAASSGNFSGVGGGSYFGNVEANNFSVGIDFAY